MEQAPVKVAFSARQYLEGKGKVFVPSSPSFFSTRGQGSPSAVLSPAQNLTAIPAHLPPARGLGALLQHHWCPLSSPALWSGAAHGVPWKEDGREIVKYPSCSLHCVFLLERKSLSWERPHCLLQTALNHLKNKVLANWNEALSLSLCSEGREKGRTNSKNVWVLWDENTQFRNQSSLKHYKNSSSFGSYDDIGRASTSDWVREISFLYKAVALILGHKAT